MTQQTNRKTEIKFKSPVWIIKFGEITWTREPRAIYNYEKLVINSLSLTTRQEAQRLIRLLNVGKITFSPWKHLWYLFTNDSVKSIKRLTKGVAVH